ncbi:MAG: hypothetical protein LBS40_03175 [Burkholderiales bacterium]|jgi:hypothetical protein|nr:hypothetical protein [Burkholderiales bacterium]
MKKILFALFSCLVFSSSHAFAQTAYNGHWYDPEQSGRGMNVDHQNGVMVVDFYGYNTDGTAQWHQAAGKTVFDDETKEITFSAALLRYQNGQCLTCDYSGTPQPDGDDGKINITFPTPTRALVTLPSGKTATMIPYYFGIARGVMGMQGVWVFTYLKDGEILYATPHFNLAYSEDGLDFLYSSDKRFMCFTVTDTTDDLMFCMEEVDKKRVTFFKAYLGPDKTYYGEVSSNQDFTSSGWFTGFRRSWQNKHDKSQFSLETTSAGFSSLPRDEIKMLAKTLTRK